jgi:hypothetical protein
MVAQEQGVLCKTGVIKSVQGTLILTNQRLIFVCGEEEVEELNVSPESGLLTYSDVDSLASIQPNPSNLSLSLSSIMSSKGHRGIGHPRLEVSWQENTSKNVTEFEQTLTGKGRMSLDKWADVIQKIKTGAIKLKAMPSVPSEQTLEGKIAVVLGDMQEKGLFEIEEQVESRFKIEADPDEIEQACEKLASNGILVALNDPSGEKFYRKVSPLESA